MNPAVLDFISFNPGYVLRSLGFVAFVIANHP